MEATCRECVPAMLLRALTTSLMNVKLKNAVWLESFVPEADDGVVVMDIGMPSLNGIDAARQFQAAQPETQIVMLSMHSDEGYVLRALKAGAKARFCNWWRRANRARM
jgi:DNA-binding NarL/FixJ family response regulator